MIKELTEEQMKIYESFIPLATSKLSNEIVDVKNEYIKCKINGVEIEIIIKDLKELLK